MAAFGFALLFWIEILGYCLSLDHFIGLLVQCEVVVHSQSSLELLNSSHKRLVLLL